MYGSVIHGKEIHETANVKTIFHDLKNDLQYDDKLLRLNNLKTTGHNLTTTIKHNNKQRNIEISILLCINISISISISICISSL